MSYKRVTDLEPDFNSIKSVKVSTHSKSFSLAGCENDQSTSVNPTYDHDEADNFPSSRERPFVDLLKKHDSLPITNQKYIDSIDFYSKLLPITIIISISGFLFGFYLCYVQVALFLRSKCQGSDSEGHGIFDEKYTLNDLEKTSLSGIVTATAGISSLLLYFYPISDKFGRKFMLLFANCLAIISVLLAFFLHI